MRLFVALVPAAEALAELATAVSALRDTAGVRWTRAEQWHITLAFLAQVDDARGTRSPRASRGWHTGTRRPHWPWRAGVFFGGQVLWTRVDGERAALLRLADAVRAAARRCGLPTDVGPTAPASPSPVAGVPSRTSPCSRRR